MSNIENQTYTVGDISKILITGRTSAYSLVKEDHFRDIRISNAI